MKCPCNPMHHYDDCCGRIHRGDRDAYTAVELMRSRYSAFVLIDGGYLQRSHHSSTRPSTEKELKDIISFASAVDWVKLDVICKQQGRVGDAKGSVEFKAYFRYDGVEDCIHEHATFVKELGKWVYVDKLKN